MCPASSGKAPIQGVHIRDVHVRLSHEPYGCLEVWFAYHLALQALLTELNSYNCPKNICHRSYTSADMPGNTSYPSGEYGNHQCDSHLTLEESMYEAIASLVADASFIIFTGDVVEDVVWVVNDTEVTNDLNDAYKT